MTEPLLHPVLTGRRDSVTANDIAGLYARIHSLIETVKEPQQESAGHKAKAGRMAGNEGFFFFFICSIWGECRGVWWCECGGPCKTAIWAERRSSCTLRMLAPHLGKTQPALGRCLLPCMHSMDVWMDGWMDDWGGVWDPH
ncbi:unnamed protein product [Mortierella alpina]